MQRDDQAAVQESPATDLATLPPAKRAVLALKSEQAEAELRDMIARTAAITTVVDKNGRKEAHSAGMMLKDARCTILATGKAVREDATAFSKAVIAEEKRLIEITAAEEERIFKLRDEFDQQEAARKAEAERIEAERVAAIRARITAISEIPASLVGKPSAEITVELAQLAERTVTAEEFAGFAEQAQMEIDNVGEVLVGMRAAAIEREEAEAERVRKQAEETARLEAQAEEQRKAAEALAETKRKLDEQAAAVAAARAAQELATARAEAEAKRQAQATADIRSIQQLGEIEGTRAILTALDAAKSMDLFVERFGTMLDLATMTRDAVVMRLENKLAALLAIEVPAAHAEALAIELELAHGEALEQDAEFNRVMAGEIVDGKYYGTIGFDPEIDAAHAEALEEDAARHRAAVAEKLPVCYEQADEAVNAGEPVEVTDLWLIDLAASELGLTRAETLARFKEIDFDALAALCEAED